MYTLAIGPLEYFLENFNKQGGGDEEILMWCALGLFSLGSAAWSQDKQPGGGTEKAVAALEQQWLQSQKTNNPELYAPLLADKFVNTNSEGKVTGKAETLANAKTI